MDFLQAFVQKLALIDPYVDGFEQHDIEIQMDELIESLPADNQQAVIPAIFQFFEKYPLNYLGLPGTFTHFIEDFWPSYEAILLASLARQPSFTTIQMVNRILNSKLSIAKRKKYTLALQQVAANKLIAPELSAEAQDLLDYQQEKLVSD
jgi:hypothetical protein